MSKCLKIALLCGGFPLAAGIAIFLMWWITGAAWLELAGLLNIGVGLVFFAIGLAALLYSCSLQLIRSDIPRPRAGLQSLALLLLLANFPAAAGIWAAVIAIERGETRYKVLVHNGARQPLVDCRVTGADCMVSFGDVPPGDSVERSFHIKGRGDLTFQGSLGGRAISQLVAADVDSDDGRTTAVTVGPSGKIAVGPDHD